MAAAYLGDTDSEDEIPLGWEERIHVDGRVYYANHQSQSTQWTHPKNGSKKFVRKELPYGWRKELDDEGKPTYVEEVSGKKTLTDPRLAFAQETKKSLFDFKQRFDASSTALQVLNGLDLSNKKALITGASSGIGLETAKSLAKYGCEVILGCRNAEKAESAIREIHKEKPTAVVEFFQVELESLNSVKNFSTEVRLKYKTLDYIFCNAATFGASFALTEDNYEKTFQVNYLSHFCLLLMLKPLLVTNSRILIMSSESHRFSMLTKDTISESSLSPLIAKRHVPFMAYNDSKLCNTVLAYELNRRWSKDGISVNSVHPGNLVSTGLCRNWWIYKLIFFLFRPFTKSLQQAAATGIWGAASDELYGVGGQYLNNCWLSIPSEKVGDEEFSKSLWKISIEMVERVCGTIALSEKTIISPHFNSGSDSVDRPPSLDDP